MRVCNPVLSIIIPAYNEEQLIGQTLRAAHAAAGATGATYEVIVADDASSDRTAAIAADHGARVVSVQHRQIAATRNAGARAARGDRFVFVDADTVISAAAVRAAVRAMHRGAVGGGCLVRFDGRIPVYAQVLLPILLVIYRVIGLAAGCFLFCTRDAFDAVGGFDDKLYGSEELALSRALKRQGRFVMLPESVTTSGRKLRAYSGWEILRILGGLALRGPNAVRQRAGMEMWYGPRRPDPEAR
jgi:glycosyltransferase involved in cell wall biosynthesis